MHKNLVIALVLSSLIYIVWFTWIVPPQKHIETQKEVSEVAKKTEITAAKDFVMDETLKQKKQDIKYELKNENIEYILNADLSIDSVLFSGPVEKTDLILDKTNPFLTFAENLNYRKIEHKDNFIKVATKKDIEITKTLTISKDNSMNSLVIEFKNPTSKTYKIPQFEINLGPGLNTVKSEEKENPQLWQAIYSYQREGRKNPVIEKIKYDYSKSDWLWAAINNRYFLFAVMNNGSFEGIKYNEARINEHNAPQIKLLTKPTVLEPKSSKTMEIKFYCGPKDYSLLKSFKNGLHLSIDFGIFAPIAKTSNSLLKFFYKHTKNYGLAIILLSILVQILMLPLSIKSYKAMAIMKKMQPEMKAIQDKYKKEPQRMNIEMMQLYKKYGANPFSGCWPMLLQIPIFFGLFTALRNSWNLHGAKFIWWIKDLSSKDPYYVLPILMGALMFAQNYISPPMTTDTTQTSIMKWMPIIFTFLFLTFPSGLVLYWIVNSIFSIAQSYYLKKKEVI